MGSLAVALLTGCAALNLDPNNSAAPDQPRPPATVPVTRGRVEQTVTAPGQLIATREQVLSFDVDGRLDTLAVRPGDAVKKGQRIASVDAAALLEAERQARADALIAQAEYSQTVRGPSAVEVNAARADLASAQAAYADLQKPPSENEVASLRATMLNAEAALKRAQAAYDSTFAADPAGIGASPAALDLEKATNDFNAARANYDKAFEQASAGKVRAASAQIAAARAKLAALEPEAAEMDAARARLDKAMLTWKKAKDDLQKAELIAPLDGVAVEVEAREGEMLRAGDAVVVLSDPRAVEVRASVIEEDLPLVRPGQEVSLFFDAAPDLPITGTVARISPRRLEGDRPLYPIYIDLDPAQVPAGLAPGMSADASVVIAKVADAVRLPRAVVKAGQGGSATVEVWGNGRREARNITIGLRGDTYVEILAGLSEGEEVVGE
jgi:HlyD family secretion protein